MTVMFCGHAEVPDVDAVQKWLCAAVEHLIHRGADTFYCGGYGQFDILAAGCLQKMKQTYPAIRSVLVLPYLDRKVDASSYDETVYPPLEHVPRRYAISKRNEFMVTWADVVVAYVRYSWGGAAATLRYAERKKKEIIRFQAERIDEN